MKTKNLLSTFVILMVGLIAGCAKDDTAEIVGVCPIVESTSPIHAETGVLPSKVITVTFNEQMNPATIKASSFSILGLSPVAGVISYNDKTASFTPTNPLAANIIYTGRITTSVKDMMGNAIQEDYVWTFSTDDTPTVIATNPFNNEGAVLLNKVITAQFSMAMSPATLLGSTFTLKRGTVPVLGAVSNDGTNISFAPTANLLAETQYTATITTAAKSLAGMPLAANYEWKFTTGQVPLVLTTDPGNNATNIALNKTISARFNMAMDPLSLVGATFTVKQGVTPVLGAVSYNGTDFLFIPAGNLTGGTEYTATINTNAKSVTGIPMAANYVWKFTTIAGVTPAVSSTSPVNLETGIVLNKIITAKFNMLMDPLTLNGTTVTLYKGLTQIAGTVLYNGTDLSFMPVGNLLPDTEYTATITTGAKNLSGISMAADYVWKFTTLAAAPAPAVSSTNPLNLEIGVSLNKIITAKFNMLMDPLTLNGTTVTVYKGVTQVSGTVLYNGTDLSFMPLDDLLPGTEYTVTITTGAKNLAGISLAANYVWKFTTVAPIPPTVIAANPTNLSIGVALNQIVAATFTVPMDPATIIGANFTLKLGAVSVIGTVSYANSVAYFTPAADLIPNTEYTATVTNGVRNATGTAMLNNYVWKFTTKTTVIPPLYTSIFASLGGSAGITNQGIYTVINNGSIATTSASTLVTGFHDNTGDKYTETPLNIGDVNGRIYCDAPTPVVFGPGGPYGGNAVTMGIAQAGLADATSFYISISPANRPGGIVLSTDELGGRTLAPGTYKSGSSYNITTLDLTLDAQGDANAVWVFQMPSALTVGTPTGPRSVHLINGALARNVFWYVGASAVINYAGGGTMVGTIIANSGITLSSPGNSTNAVTRTVLNGRAISLISSVTMVNTVINVPN